MRGRGGEELAENRRENKDKIVRKIRKSRQRTARSDKIFNTCKKFSLILQGPVNLPSINLWKCYEQNVGEVVFGDKWLNATFNQKKDLVFCFSFEVEGTNTFMIRLLQALSSLWYFSQVNLTKMIEMIVNTTFSFQIEFDLDQIVNLLNSSLTMFACSKDFLVSCIASFSMQDILICLLLSSIF